MTRKGPMLMKAVEQIHAPNRLDVALGLRIRQRRKALSVSQTALADAIGLTFQQIQKYERGFNRVSFSRLVDIAHALDCRVIDLIGDLDDASIPSPLFRQDTAHLREAGAPDLLAAYAAAPPTLRKAVLKLVQEIAKDHRARAAEGDEAEAEPRRHVGKR
ncbi:MAG TPA: helix-turn-helix transcriptional regulator [Caulobacteraceae bacterium]|nr:helix-turn-helix transcriptional regulator [Caulobacteraceae bacterium]